MRTIKFRGKRLDGQGWVVGFYQPHANGKVVFIGDYSGLTDIPKLHKVIPESVGQWTGLVDMHGTEIFEGDIVKATALLNDHHQRVATVVSPVEYWHGATCLSITYVPLSLDFQVSHEIEIIGNIHDKICTYKDSGCGSCEVPSESRTCNPELMEVEPMSNTTYKYTDLKIRMVEVEFENWENDGYINKTYFEIVDDGGNVYLTLDSLG